MKSVKSMKEVLSELEIALKQISTQEEMDLVEHFVREHFNDDGSIVFDLSELIGEEVPYAELVH